jgi:hypothetical protein
MTSKRRLLVALTVALSCGDNRAPAEATVITTSVSSVDAGGTTIEAQITNTGDKDAFVATCGPGPQVFAERRENDQWIRLTGACPVSPSPFLTLPPGTVVTAGLFLSTPGRYRVTADIASASTLHGATLVTSSEFDIP